MAAAVIVLSCAASMPALRLVCEGEPEQGIVALWVQPSEPGVFIDSILAFDSDNNLVLRYVNAEPDKALLHEPLRVDPGAIEPDGEYSFWLFTDRGTVRLREKVCVDSTQR